MTHLMVDLFERGGKRLPCCSLNDHEVTNRQYFHDLYTRGVAKQIVRVVVRPGDEYRTGDHILLRNRVNLREADTVTIDPDIASEVHLDEIMFNARGFAERPAAIMIVTNPNQDSSYRLRISLFDQVDQQIPSLVFYDWEYPGGVHLADLRPFHFADKTAYIRVEPGPDYQPGDQVVLWDKIAKDSPTYALEPGEYDLSRLILEEHQNEPWAFMQTQRSWLNTVSGVTFALQPKVLLH